LAAASENWLFRAPGYIDRIEACFTGAAFGPHRHDIYAVGVTLVCPNGVIRFRC
jgi:hypothetical protein